MHVLRTLAPDGAVIRWNSNSKYLHKGRPTRFARLHFLIAPAKQILSAEEESRINEYINHIDDLSSFTYKLTVSHANVDPSDFFERTRELLSDLLTQIKKGTN